MNFIVQLVVFAVLCSVVRCQIIETCTSCETMYNAAKTKAAVNNVEKCTAAKEHLNCLFKAYDDDANAAGCNNVATMVTTTETEMTTLVSLGTQCVSTETCGCQKTYLKSAKTTEYDRCGAASILGSCVETAVDVACDGTITNAIITTDVKRIFNNICSGSSVLSQVTMFVFILSVIGHLMAKQ